MRRWFVMAGLAVVLALAPCKQANAKAQPDPVTVRLIRLDRPARRLIVASNRPLTAHGFALPARWVVDLAGAVYRGKIRRLVPVQGSPIHDVRIGQFKSTVVRLVFDFDSGSTGVVPVETRHFTRHGPGRTLGYRLVFDLTPTPTKPKARPVSSPSRTSAPKARVALSRPPPPPPRFEKTSPDDSAFPRTPLPPSRPDQGVTVRRTGNGWIVRLVASRPIAYTLDRHGHRDRLYVRIQGGHVDVPSGSALADEGLPATVDVVQQASGSEQILIQMRRPMRYQAWLADGRRAIILVLSPPQQQFVPRAGEDRITVDPGHGGADPGTIGPGNIDEKAVTLALATRLEELMVAHGLDVQLTRITDTSVPLRPRVQMGDEFRSDAFISIHMNHSDDPAIHGIETYYFTTQSQGLADDIQRHLVEALGATDRGVRRDNFVVVKYTQVPACLVEVGYLSNPHEEKLLDSTAYQLRAAKGILAGLQDYLSHHRLGVARRRREQDWRAARAQLQPIVSRGTR